MLQRNCAGGVVFSGEKLLLLRNDKNEWVLPKGLVPAGALSYQVAKDRVAAEAGVSPVEIVCPAGETRYEFYSTTRKCPVCNHIVWYAMRAFGEDSAFNAALGFTGGGFFPLDRALDLITYSQDKALAAAAWEKLRAAEAGGKK